jgi:hypothetical protein
MPLAASNRILYSSLRIFWNADCCHFSVAGALVWAPELNKLIAEIARTAHKRGKKHFSIFSIIMFVDKFALRSIAKIRNDTMISYHEDKKSVQT